MNLHEFVARFYPEDRQLIKHTHKWIDNYDNNKYSLVLSPREHTKSTTIRKWIIHNICEWLDVRVLIASHKERLANSFAMDILRHLERPELRNEYGYTIGKPWNKGEAFVQTDIVRPHATATLSTVAVGAGVTGERFDIIVMDDLLTIKNQKTEKHRENIKEWIEAELYPALDTLPTSKWVVVGTRKNLEDWYSELLQMPHWKTLVEKLYTHDPVTNEKVYLWPERFNEEIEIEKRSQMSPARFATEYMNEPIPSEGLRFRREWIEPFFYNSWRNEVPERHREIYMGIDPTVGSKTGKASFMGLAVVCFDKRPDRQDIYVVDMVRSKLSLAEQTDIIVSKLEEWKPHAAMIEADLVNKMFSERMLRQMPLLQPVVYRAHGASTNLKGSTDIQKIARIENIIGWLFKKGKIHLKDPAIDPMSKIFIEAEYLQFPEGKLDLMDALNMACDRIDMRKQIKKINLWKF